MNTISALSEEKEVIKKKINTTRVFVLIPEENGYRTVILKKNLGDGKFRYETAGGKVDKMCPTIKGEENPEYDPSLFIKDNAGNTIFAEGAKHIVRESACSESEEELGIKINPEDLMHVAYTERPTVDSDGKPDGGKHCTNTYVVIAPSNEYFNLANDDEDRIMDGEIPSTIHQCAKKKNDTSDKNSKTDKKAKKSPFIENQIPPCLTKSSKMIKNILRETEIYKDNSFIEAIKHHYPDPAIQLRILTRLKILIYTTKFKQQEKKILEKASSLKALTYEKMHAEELRENPNNLVLPDEQPASVEAPSGAQTTAIDYFSEWKDLTLEEKEWRLHNDFGKNGDEFFTIPELKDAIIEASEKQKYLGLGNITKIKEVMKKINSFDEFTTEMLKKENFDIAPIFLTLNKPFKRLFDQGITPEAVRSATDTLNNFGNEIETIDTVDNWNTREKSWARILFKFLHKGKTSYIPGDLAGMRITCKSGQQKDTAYAVKAMIEKLSAQHPEMNIQVKPPEDSSTKTKKGGDRFGEFKVEGTINGIGFEIQINDAYGYSQSEAIERSHFIYEYVRTFAVKSRLMDTIPQSITQEELEELIRSSFSQHPEYLSGQTQEEAVKNTMNMFDNYGFFIKDDDQKIYIDYQQLFINKYRTSEHYKTILHHFSSKLDGKLKQFEKPYSLSATDWHSIFHDPLSFFRNYAKANDTEKDTPITNQLYKNIISIFFFHISGESSNFHLHLKKWNPTIYETIEEDRDNYKALQSQLKSVDNKIDRLKSARKSITESSIQRDDILDAIVKIENQYHLEI